MTVASRPARPRRRWLWLLLVPLAVAIVSLGGLYVWQMYVLDNFHEVVPGQVYRSRQPSSADLIAWAQAHQIRTVINLRGDDDIPVVQSEVDTLNRLGINYVSLRLPVKHLPSPEELRSLIEAVENAQRPLLIHCRAGADRAGLASCIAVMAIGHQSFESGETQISLRYWHFGLDSRTDVTGPAEIYEDWCHNNQHRTAGWKQFRKWAYETYSVAN